MSDEETGIGGHHSQEWMILNGYAEEATEEDLQALPDERLREIALLCPALEYAPDECVPCLAHVLLARRIQAREGQSSASPGEEEIPFEEQNVEFDTPKLDALLHDEDTPFEPYGKRVSENRHADPVREIARQAGYLQELVSEMLDGPPIPPREVSLEELAALVVGAEKWVQMMDAQGMELAPSQEAIKDRIRAVLAKVKRHG